jgi:branched-chain amino acid transport system substrate-binding protein
MFTRRSFLQSSAAAAAFAATAGSARADNAPGVTDAEIKIGQTMPYSGPASAYGVIGRTEAAYFKMINEQGGINGRKINLISLDDGYSPPKTVEQVRRLVEQEQVAFLFNTLGTAPNAAIRQYLNDNKVPQLFVSTGASMFSDPKHFPWTMGFNPNYQTEGHIYGKYILATKPDAKISVLYQNDGFGKDYLIGLKEALGADRAGMIVKEASYETSEPTIDSRIVTLQGSGADVIVIATTPKFGAQAIRKTFDLGWTPVRIISNVSSSVNAALKPAGLEKSKGLITATYGKDPNDPRWKDDAGLKEWKDFTTKYMSATEFTDLRRLWLRRRGDHGSGSQAMWEQSVAREHHEAGRQYQGPCAADGLAGRGNQHLARQL